MEDIESFVASLKTCPKCGSGEGFWLTATREKSYAQCKTCGATLELIEMFSQHEKGNQTKSGFRKLKF